MKIKFVGKNVEFTEAMKNVTAEKLNRLQKYVVIGENTEARVLARTYPHAQKVEITIPLRHGVLRTEQTGSDYYEALNLSVDLLERQIWKMKTKLVERHKEGLAKAFIDEAEQSEPLNIVREKVIVLEAMDDDEAILQMELAGHNFYLYREAGTNLVSVVYRRNDGGYGIIRGII